MSECAPENDALLIHPLLKHISRKVDIEMGNERKREGYGFSLLTPIHVAGFDEERIYLDNLRVIGNKRPPQIRRIGSNLSPETGHPVDLYEAMPAGWPHKMEYLYIDLYGASDWRAPEGYELLCDRPMREDGEQPRELGEDLHEMIKRIFMRYGDE